MADQGLNREQWLEKLAQVNTHLEQQGAQAHLTLIGSATGIFAGQSDRTSMDLDVWRPKSRFQMLALRNAVEQAGLLFNPKTALEPDKPYIQIVDPGLVQLGKFDETEGLETFGALTLERPPVANLIAAKLIRAAPRDIEDISFLLNTYRPERVDIENAIRSMPREAREKAQENLVYLDVLNSPDLD